MLKVFPLILRDSAMVESLAMLKSEIEAQSASTRLVANHLDMMLTILWTVSS